MFFKPADPSRRLPTYLQSHTKENLVWQLKLTAGMLVVMLVKDWWQDRQEQKRLEPYKAKNQPQN